MRWAARMTVCLLVLASTGCSQVVGGLAVFPATEEPGPSAALDIDDLMLDLQQMRALTGAGDDLTIIPSMDSRSPVDIDLLASEVPEVCRFVFVETAVFGSSINDFHKTTYQSPPDAALISQAAARYPDQHAARATMTGLTDAAAACADTPSGASLIGEVVAAPDGFSSRTSPRCGRDYRVKASVLAEVTFCEFPESVSELVMTNLLAGAPG